MMKNKILFNSFLMLAMMFTFSSGAFASEVTGTLSSSTTQSDEQTTGTLAGTVDGGSSGGGGSSSGSSRRSTTQNNPDTGTVLGAATVNNSPPSNNIAYIGTALQPNYNNTDYEEEVIVAQAFDGTVFGESTTQVAQVADSTSLGAWFWILLILLLVAITRYIYVRNRKESRN